MAVNFGSHFYLEVEIVILNKDPASGFKMFGIRKIFNEV